MGGELNRINPTVVEGAEDIMGAEDSSFKADTFKFNWNERNQNPRNRPARRMTERQFSDLQRMQRMGRSMGFRAEGMGQKMSQGQFEALRRMVQQQQSGRSVIRGDMSRMLRRDLRRAEYLGNMEYMQGRILEEERRKNRDAKDAETFGAESSPVIWDDEIFSTCLGCGKREYDYYIFYPDIPGADEGYCMECYDGGDAYIDGRTVSEEEILETYNFSDAQKEKIRNKITSRERDSMNAESEYEYWCSYCGDSGPKTSSPRWCKTYERNGGSGYHSQMCGTCYDTHEGLCYYCESGDDYRAESFEANETDANMVSEGSVDAFYGGGAKVSVSSAGIQPTANPSVDEAFDVGNQVGLDVAEQEVMNENPSVEVNYGAEGDVVDLTQELASKVGFRLGGMSASALVLGVAALAGYRYARR